MMNGLLGIDYNTESIEKLERRYKLFHIMPEQLLGMLKSDGDVFQVSSNLPKDARIVNARYDDQYMRFDLIIYSDSYDVVSEAQPIPDAMSMAQFKVIA